MTNTTKYTKWLELNKNKHIISKAEINVRNTIRYLKFQRLVAMTLNVKEYDLE